MWLQAPRPYQPTGPPPPQPRPHSQAQQLPRDPWDPTSDPAYTPPSGPAPSAPGPAHNRSAPQQSSFLPAQAQQTMTGTQSGYNSQGGHARRQHQPYMPHLAEQQRLAQVASQPPQQAGQPQGQQPPAVRSVPVNVRYQPVQASRGANDSQGRPQGRPHGQGPAPDLGRTQQPPQQDSVQGQGSQRGAKGASASIVASGQALAQQQEGQSRPGQARTLPLPTPNQPQQSQVMLTVIICAFACAFRPRRGWHSLTGHSCPSAQDSKF